MDAQSAMALEGGGSCSQLALIPQAMVQTSRRAHCSAGTASGIVSPAALRVSGTLVAPVGGVIVVVVGLS